jgi:hypothetical protein
VTAADRHGRAGLQLQRVLRVVNQHTVCPFYAWATWPALRIDARGARRINRFCTNFCRRSAARALAVSVSDQKLDAVAR